MKTLARAALLLAALTAAGCDAGGLLIVDGVDAGGLPPVVGPSAMEFVSGGTVAKSSNYRIFYVVGQPTPNQGVSTSPDGRLNGGLTGAVSGDK